MALPKQSEKPAKVTKPTKFRLDKANYFRDGIYLAKGSVFTLPAGERPSRTWTQLNDDGSPVVKGESPAAAVIAEPAGVVEEKTEHKHGKKHF
jgi:hypothetical protein